MDDKVHGRGVSVFSSGNRYEGEWVDGKINGQGTLWYADGDKYQGEWKDGKMHGRGTYTYADGDRYEGDWKDDRRHGKGTVTYAANDGGVAGSREGDWSDGKMHGYGNAYSDGGVYEGEWVDGKMHGHGLYAAVRRVASPLPRAPPAPARTRRLARARAAPHPPAGNKYDGEWQNDVKEYGVLRTSTASSTRGWKDDKAHGEDAHVHRRQVRRRLGGGEAGAGRAVHASGDMFHGEWMATARRGAASHVRQQQPVRGSWVDDRQHGRGVFVVRARARPPARPTPPRRAARTAHRSPPPRAARGQLEVRRRVGERPQGEGHPLLRTATRSRATGRRA